MGSNSKEITFAKHVSINDVSKENKPGTNFSALAPSRGNDKAAKRISLITP